MCGIAGYIDKSGKYKTSHELLKKMTDKMIHRGPDAEGQWIDKRVALGHRRLSIIDLDAKSNQPMFSYDKRFVIIYNGEIYNYVELKEELAKKGACFKTNSDTEVILEAYRVYGTDCFNKFNGMWAFALYDMEEQKVILCRDRFGIKPLYIVDNNNAFIFASEMKAIIEAFPNENIPNEVWISRYIPYSRWEDSDGECFYKNIKGFPRASYMIYDLQKNTSKYVQYWKVDERLFYEKWIHGRNPVKTFKKLFDSAVGLRLRADVEVGACLSGGIDSSSIVGCVYKKYKGRIHTFSSIYKDKDCNEEKYIRKVNKKCRTIPHYIKPDDYEGNFINHLEKLTYYHDQPTMEASLYSGYMVMKGVHGAVKVLLDGQGADELFAGYETYPGTYLYDLLDKNTFLSRLEGIKIISIFRKENPDYLETIGTDAVVNLVGIKNSFLFKAVKEQDILKNIQIFTDDFLNQVKDQYQVTDIQCSSRLNTRLCNDLVNYVIPQILHNEDGNSMAFSIESRVPFLDYRIVEFALALDAKYKIKNKWSKWIVREACKNYLPRAVRRRRKKMGFPAPFGRWLCEGKSKDEIAEVIYSFGNRNIVPKETIDRLYKAHIDKEGDFSGILFRILSLELWLRMSDNQKVG